MASSTPDGSDSGIDLRTDFTDVFSSTDEDLLSSSTNPWPSPAELSGEFSTDDGADLWSVSSTNSIAERANDPDISAYRERRKSEKNCKMLGWMHVRVKQSWKRRWGLLVDDALLLYRCSSDLSRHKRIRLAGSKVTEVFGNKVSIRHRHHHHYDPQGMTPPEVTQISKSGRNIGRPSGPAFYFEVYWGANLEVRDLMCFGTEQEATAWQSGLAETAEEQTTERLASLFFACVPKGYTGKFMHTGWLLTQDLRKVQSALPVTRRAAGKAHYTFVIISDYAVHFFKEVPMTNEDLNGITPGFAVRRYTLLGAEVRLPEDDERLCTLNSFVLFSAKGSLLLLSTWNAGELASWLHAARMVSDALLASALERGVIFQVALGNGMSPILLGDTGDSLKFRLVLGSATIMLLEVKEQKSGKGGVKENRRVILPAKYTQLKSWGEVDDNTLVLRFGPSTPGGATTRIVKTLSEPMYRLNNILKMTIHSLAAKQGTPK